MAQNNGSSKGWIELEDGTHIASPHSEPSDKKANSDYPTKPGEWELERILSKLKRRLPDAMLDKRKQGNQMLTYIHWYKVNEILDKYTPGWTWEIRQMTTTTDRLFVIGRLTLCAAEGNIYREATGTEVLKEDKEVYITDLSKPPDKDGKQKQMLLRDDHGRAVKEARELAYGDPSSNAESMAFRRAAARFGLGLYLYDK